MLLGYEDAKRFCFSKDMPAYAIEILKELVNSQVDAAKSAYLISVIYFTGLLDSQEEEPQDLISLEDAQPEIEKMFKEGLRWLEKANQLGSDAATLLLAKIYLNGLAFFSGPSEPIFVDGTRAGFFVNRSDINSDPELATGLLEKIKFRSPEAAQLLREEKRNPAGAVFQFEQHSFWSPPGVPTSASRPIPRYASNGSNCSMKDSEPSYRSYGSEETESDEFAGSPPSSQSSQPF